MVCRTILLIIRIFYYIYIYIYIYIYSSLLSILSTNLEIFSSKNSLQIGKQATDFRVETLLLSLLRVSRYHV